ncbi:alpha-tocopherol transfer protein-like [Cataglyphis hispanica]|uniref:alpha-tocopherol transfer protein-like n=1 Tax=Cataglyphis hispanica TaxID=1086592 RepID=UPI00217FE9F5|nr:alpha-tocopherol transfer protein-like [Cataglyphis hispanica]XP_050453205.1 alpha-tocopherol transfer protein-like [Cataglyphis hispanica]XP_050453206.1 alpha-tocopherol transfer protein-like [Cataglyphis hispanica]
MASSVTIEENFKYPSKEDVYQNWLENAPKIKFGEHELHIELDNEQIDEYFGQKAKEELRETPEIIAESCTQLKELIAGEPDLNVPNEKEFYQMFLRPCKYYPKSAFSLMKRYYRFRLNYPHMYANLLPSKEKTAFYANLVYPLPLRAKDGSRIIIIEAGKRWNPKEVSVNLFFKGLIMLLYLALAEPRTQIAGGRVIIDVEGFSLTHVTYITPSFAKMVIEFVQKCLPLRLKSIHIVNQSFFFNMAFAIFKPFLEEKIRKRIHFHGTDWGSLMTFIGKKALLKRHGGELDIPEGPFGITFCENILFCEPFFEVDLQCGYKMDNSIK